MPIKPEAGTPYPMPPQADHMIGIQVQMPPEAIPGKVDARQVGA